MLKSMTGYGKATLKLQNKTITVEIKSLNSKSFDLNLRLPEPYKKMELELRSELSQSLERGKIDFSFTTGQEGKERKYVINSGLAKEYFNELKKIDLELKLNTPDYLRIIMNIPDIFSSKEADFDEKEWEVLKKTIGAAIEEFNAFRQKEGKQLEADIVIRVKKIGELQKEVEGAAPLRIKNVKEKLNTELTNLVSSNAIDKNRLEQELIYFLEKMDITEECVRLKSHCEYFLETMNEKTSNGRKLNFICQEMGREINTMGSKANDSGIQKAVVQMKDELEKIKEQLLNVL